MGKTLDEVIAALPRKQQAEVKRRAAELIAEEMTLRDLRKAMELTQVRMSELLDVKQNSISRLEARSDMLLSTLTGYVAAMGGRMRLVAEFPDRPPVTLRGLADVAPLPRPPGVTASRRRSAATKIRKRGAKK